MADNETTADIRKDAEAKFRELVESYMQRRAAFQTTVGAMQAFNIVFDRLEAAHKRELSKNVSKNGADFGQLGNAAKLHEALTKVKEWMEHRIATCGFEPSATFPTMLEDVVLPALAEPVRNCDLYRTKEEAQEAFLGEACDHPCGNCWVEDINNECGVEWLLAHATEKEGGAK